MCKTYIIADGGACHDSQLSGQLALVHAAAMAGCDAYKTQWTSDPIAMAGRRGRAAADGYADVYARYLAWPKDWHRRLADACCEAGLDYMCTVFIPADIAIVAPHVARFKVASFEASDVAFLAAHGPYRQPILVSTGLLSGEEFYTLTNRRFTGKFRVRWLHCVSAYPAPIDALNLAVVRENTASGCERIFSGMSDHSAPALTWTGALAVAAGAHIVEAHLRLDETDPANPDYPHAMTSRQFTEYVTNIRFAEACVGSGGKRLQDCERPMAEYRVAPTPAVPRG